MKYIKIRNVTSLLFLLAAVFFLSNEANAQWTQVAKPNGVTVQALVSVGTNIFAGFNGYNTHYGGIYRSIDDGDTWIAVDSGLVKFGDDTLNILCLTAMGDTIVAGTDAMVYLSRRITAIAGSK